MQTKTFTLMPAEHRNYSAMLIALWPQLKWRHAGFGALQAYIMEGLTHELRVHIWHPSLIKPGIEDSGLCHDHRFHMRSNVLVGKIIQTEFRIDPDPEGDWETLKVLHAREAMARGGSFHHDPTPTGDYYRRSPYVYEVAAGHGYTFDKFAFHETRAEGITVTLVEKSQQEDVNARILAPRGKPVVCAFTETQSPEEFSGALAAGLAASCDFLPSLDNSPHHIQGNVFDHLDDGWDGAIFHPTCTYLTISAEWAYKDPDYNRYPGVGYHQKVKPETLVGEVRRIARLKALNQFLRLLNCKIPLVGIENPRGVVSTHIRPPDQTIQPYEFGDDASKATCLWLKGWPKLVPTKRIPGRMVEWPRGSGKMVERWSNQTDSNQNKLTPSDDRWAERSKTYPGIAEAIARQWSPVMFGELRMTAE